MYANRIFCAAILALAAGTASAEATLQDCLRAVTAVRPGKFLKVEYFGVSGQEQALYSIDVRPTSGRIWTFECSAATAQIVGVAQRASSVNDEVFAKRAKISLSDAKSAATGLYPGRVGDVHFEVSANGKPQFDIEIADQDGIELKIRVSALSGDIEAMRVKSWEVGAIPPASRP